MTLRVCFLALNAYPAIRPTQGRAIGGLESSAWNFARVLAEKPDFDVSIVVRHSRVPQPTIEQGVSIFPIVDRLYEIRHNVSQQLIPADNLAGLRLSRPQWSLPWQLALLTVTRMFRDRRPVAERIIEQLAAAQPDVCVCLGTGADQRTAIEYASGTGKPSIAMIRSNADVDRQCFQDSSYINPYGESAESCRYVIDNALSIICQTRFQQDEIKTLTGRSSHRLPNPIELERWNKTSPTFSQRQGVLWIGRYDQFHKRPLMAIQIARKCPNVPFTMVINAGDQQVKEQLNRDVPQNVKLLDYVPRTEMPNLMKRARILLSTGSAQYEGFPNVFLEAAASHTPIVALQDVDQFVENSGAGHICSDETSVAADCITRLIDHQDHWQQRSERGFRWVKAHHNWTPIMDQFCDIIRTVASSPSRDS